MIEKKKEKKKKEKKKKEKNFLKNENCDISVTG